MSARLLIRAGAVIALTTLLTACPKPTRPPAPEVPAVPAPTAVQRDAVVYQVNPQASTLHILVYRAGALARLGHNHVMTVQDLQGRLWVHQTLAKSGFEVSFPVAQMVVDDPQARTEAGSEFPPDIPPADREGTRRNMLRTEVLDAEHYPRIELKSVSVTGTAQKPDVTARVTIKDVSRDVTLQPSVKIDGTRLTVSGELDLLQSDFGIKPFSAALGALTVQDRLHIKFKVVAEKK